MKDLFKGELLRFRLWAIAAAVIHVAVLGFMARLVDLAQQPKLVYQVFGMVYAVAGVLLGLYQMGTYRRANHWLNLLHRPLHRLRIAGALCGAGGVVLAVAIALPILAVAGYQEALTARVVDVRHWLLPVAALLIAACGYLAGAYGMLANRRYSAAAALLPMAFMFSHAPGLAALAVQAIVLLSLAVLVGIAFKPQLDEPPRHPLAVAATALPVQVAAYFLLWMLGTGYEIGLTALGMHPLNGAQPAPTGYIAAGRMEPKERLLAGLASSRDADAPLWREQAALSDVFALYPMRDLPIRGQLTGTMQPLEFDESERPITWTFSHDRMRFVGRGSLDGRPRGELGVGEGNAPFPGPAMPIGGGYLATPTVAYQYDEDQHRVFPRVRLPAGEVFAGMPEAAGENIAVLSDRALYIYPGREAANTLDVLKPVLRMPMPGPVGKLSSVELMELLDGYLVSFTYTNGAWSGEAEPYQQVMIVNSGRSDGTGHVRQVSRRALTYDLPLAYTMRSWWLSPALRELCLSVQELLAPRDPLGAGDIPPPPRNIVLLAAVLCMLSLLGAIVLTRRRIATPLARWAWVLACGVVGLPALASLWLLYPATERATAPAPARMPAGAPVAG
ncbi:MAG: hypothetical protein ACTHOC_01445, partial [Luteimonas sp.]